MRVLLVGIAGTSRDFLLSLPTLSAFVNQDQTIRKTCQIEALYHKYILPALLPNVCGTLSRQIAAFQPDLVGFSTYVWNSEAVRRLVHTLKTESPQVRIVLGGPEISGRSIQAGEFNDLPVNFLVYGEGELPFLGLLRHSLSPASQPLESIPRLYCRQNGAFVPSDAEGILPDLTALPSPFLTGEVPDWLLRQPGMHANIETQRGCSLRCSYCLYHGHFPSIRYRDAKVVLAELEYVHAHGVQHCRITDANFLSNREFAAQILSGMIARRLRMSLFMELIPSFLDERIAGLLAEYRALGNEVLAGIGLQSINPRALRAIRRNIPIAHFDKAYRLLSEAGAVVKTDIILGLPQEDLESYTALLEYVAERMRQGRNSLAISLLRILPGTELETVAEREGLVLDTRDHEHFVYETPTLPRADLIECLRLSTAAFRLLCSSDANSNRLRERYFEAKDQSGASHAQLFTHFARYFLGRQAGDYSQEDFPNAEHYWSFEVHRDFSDAVIIEQLAQC